jgi:hypothetical protein
MHGVRLWQFVSHKLIRWCVGASLVVTLIATAMLARDNGWFAGFLALQLVCYTLAFGGWLMRRSEKMPRALQVPFYFTMVNCAALVAMGRFVTGSRQGSGSGEARAEPGRRHARAPAPEPPPRPQKQRDTAGR